MGFLAFVGLQRTVGTTPSTGLAGARRESMGSLTTPVRLRLSLG